jgi:hypothetical protein
VVHVRIATKRPEGELHRSAITSADKLVVSSAALVSTDVPLAGILLHNTTYNSAYAPGNVFGSAGLSALSACATADDANDTHMVDMTIPQVVGAVYYDIFLSTDVTPLWVGRVTEIQRAAGAKITAVGTVTSPSAGVAAGDVRVNAVGTGLDTGDTVFFANNAYVLTGIDGIDCSNCYTAIIHVQLTLTDLRSTPGVVLVIIFEDDQGTTYVGDTIAVPIMLGGEAQTLKQAFVLETLGAAKMYVLIGYIAGQGAAATIRCEKVC